MVDALGGFAVRLMTLGLGLRPDPRVLADPARILVVRLDHLGDVLCTRPCLEALRVRFPQARITVLAAGAGGEMYRRDPNVDEVLCWEAPWFSRAALPKNQPGFFALARLLRRRRFDLSLDLRGDFRHHVLLRLAGVRVRAGYGITGGAFLLHCAPRLRPGLHEVERNLELAEVVGVGPGARDYTPIRLNEEERVRAEAWWNRKQRRVAVHPASGDFSRRAPAERFAEICNALGREGCEVVLIGSAQERPLAESIARACRVPPRVLAGETTLGEVIGLISTADVFIGNVSGPMHLAVTQGRPVVVLWGDVNPESEWGPWGEHQRSAIVHHPERPAAAAEAVSAALAWLREQH